MQLIVDLANGVQAGLSQPPASLAANTNGAGVDLQNADVRTHMIVQEGTITGSAVFFVKAQESDDNSTFTDVADSNANTGNINTANTATIKSFTRTKRYVRSVATLVSGTSALLGVTVMSQKKYEGSNNAGYSISPQS